MEEKLCIIIYLKAASNEDLSILLEAATDNMKDGWLKAIEVKNETENSLILVRFVKHSRLLRLNKSMTEAKLRCKDPPNAFFDIYHFLIDVKSHKTGFVN